MFVAAARQLPVVVAGGVEVSRRAPVAQPELDRADRPCRAERLSQRQTHLRPAGGLAERPDDRRGVEPEPGGGRGRRLVALGRRLNTFIDFRNLHEDYRKDVHDAYIIADESAVLYRNDRSRLSVTLMSRPAPGGYGINRPAPGYRVL